MTNRNFSRRVIGHHHGDCVRGNPAGALITQFAVLGAQRGQAADTGAEIDTEAFRIDMVSQSGIFHSFHGSGNGEQAERIIAADKTAIHRQQGIKVLYLCCQGCLKISGVKFCDGGNAVLACGQAGPSIRHIVADGGNRTEACHCNSSHRICSSFPI